MSIMLFAELLTIFEETVFLKLFGFFKKGENIIFLVLLAACSGIEVNFLNREADNVTNNIYISLLANIIIILFIIYDKDYALKNDIMEILLIIIITISVIPSIVFHQIKDIDRYLSLVILYFIIFALKKLFRILKEKVDYNKVFNIFTYISIYNSILGVAQYITGKKLLYGRFTESINYGEELSTVKRVVGIIGSNNAAGNLAFIFFAILLYNYLRNRRKIELLGIILDLIFSALTLTRIGYMAIGITIIIWLLARCHKKNEFTIKMLIVLGMIIVSVIVIYFLGDRIYDILFLKRGNTQDARSIQFEFALKSVINKENFLFGIGTGQYRNYVNNVLNHFDLDMHSEYINILIENGLIAFVLFIIFNVTLFNKALKNNNIKMDKIFIVTMFIGNLICCNFNPNQYYEINNVFYYVLMYSFLYKNSHKEDKLSV